MNARNAQAFTLVISALAHAAAFATGVTYKFTGEVTGTPIGIYNPYTAGT